MTRFVVVLLALAVMPAGASAQPPLGVVGNTLGRFDRDSLLPLGQTIPVGEPKTGPVVSPLGGRFALGVSSSAPQAFPASDVSACGSWIRRR